MMNRGVDEATRPTRWRRARLSLLLIGTWAGALSCEGSPDVVATWNGEDDSGLGGAPDASSGGSSSHSGGRPSDSGGSTAGGNEPSGGTGGANPPTGGTGGATIGPAPEPLNLTGDLEMHDVTVFEEDGEFFAFHTGGLLKKKTSANLLDWQSDGEVFDELPSWIVDTLPEVTSLWAPDVAYFGGTFHLYYAASTPGSGRSCVGHATKESVSSPGKWTDRGSIICTDLEEGENDLWDAIDPGVLIGPGGQTSLVVGSWGEGLKLLPLTDDGEWLGEELVDVARRGKDDPSVQAGELVYHEPYYYLFVSFGQCCIGTESESRIHVGRSIDKAGPYVDREGTAMMEGGGTLLFLPNDRFVATGASDVFTSGGQTYMAYHAYDASAGGQAILRIVPLFWKDGWPDVPGP